MNGLEVTVTGADLSAAGLREVSRMAFNKTLTAARTFTIRKTSETYNLSTRQLQPYVNVRRVSVRADQVSGSVDLHVKAIPIEAFKPRVVMIQRQVTWRGHSFTRKFAGIYLQRYRATAAKLIAPAFPLRQRRAGPLRSGEQVRRRIGADRDRLTVLRYYTFPRHFIDETLAPAVRSFAGERIRIEFPAAFRAYRKGNRTLRRNA